MWNNMAVIMAALALAGTGGIAAAAAETAAPAPQFVLTKAAAPVVDGKLDDACWQAAPRYPLKHYAGGELNVGGSVAVSYDAEGLSVALWLDEPTPANMKAPKVEVNAPGLWDGEVIEWFIAPSEDGSEYAQLGWNPAGSQFNARCVSTGPATFRSDATWRPTWTCASVVGDKGWTTEARITFAALGVKPPADGDCWRLNVNRSRQIDGREWSGMAVTGTGGFHVIDRFAEVYFGKYVAPDEQVRRDGPCRALIGCWGHSFGLAAIFEPHVQLDRALGAENVDIRPEFSESMLNWPRRYRDLARYSLVVLTDVPAAYFTDKQLQDLRRYIAEGGTLVLMGPMAGWKHKPDDGWWKSPLAELMPTKPSGKIEIRTLDPAPAKDSPLFKGIPVDTVKLTVRSSQVALADGATLLASVGGVPFIAEKTADKGRVIQVQGEYAHKSTQVPISSFRTDLFMSAYYPVFWDNLVQYATGRPAPRPAAIPAAPAPRETALLVDLIADNIGDMFCPGASVRVKPVVQGRADYPYEVTASLQGAVLGTVPAGTFTLTDAASEFQVLLPNLDRGRYTLRLELRKAGTVVDAADASFAVALPLLPEDEFNFKAEVDCAYQGDTDARRIAAELKSIGFTGIAWLGGEIYAGYQGVYRLWNEGRIESIFQEAGLRVTPVWYANLYEVVTCYTGRKPGQPNPSTKLTFPDMGYPGKDYLPHAQFWHEVFGRKMQGRLPLTDGYAAADEIIGVCYPASDRVQKSFETATGVKAPAQGQADGAYQFLNYRLQIASNFVWFARAVSNAYDPAWSFESVITPNSFCGHSSCLADIPGTLSGLGATSPDEYWYGEPKLYLKSLSSMAMAWSATDFGRLSRPDFMGGQLSRAYYDEFPEQVFAALSAGARNFSVFAYDCTNFETNGRQDPKFADIARRTTHDASRIGRTLNHCDRARARVAMLYPHTAHMWLSMGKDFNDDYLKMTGTSDQYLPLTYAVQAEFDLLRRTFGHVDVLFDEQIARGELRNYDVFVLAYARQVEEQTLRELRRFAEHGGTLLVTTDSGRLNENNQPTDLLYAALPAAVGEEMAVSADYSDTRMSKPELFSRGNVLSVKEGAELLFSLPGEKPVCVRGAVGLGEAVVLGMPLAALRSAANEAKLRVVAYVLDRRAALISRPADGEFSAITFTPRRGEGRVFMVFNGHKAAAETTVEACGDEVEAKHVLADIVTGEKIPFAVKDGKLTFAVSCPARWGRALALMPKAPVKIEVSAAGGRAAGDKFMVAVRLLGADDQPLRSTLPFELTVKDLDGQVRDDLGGVRVADQGVYVFAMDWPVAAKKGTWTVAVAEKVSGAADSATWQAP